MISRKLRSDLDIIRSIRNDYAHQLRKVGLDHQAFMSRIVGLNSLRHSNIEDKAPGEMLAEATQKIGLFLIGRTAPSNLLYDSKLLAELSCLDYSNYDEVKRRDNLLGNN